ncbi:DUF4174 domain-containing protein [Motilimonas pumila]|uniref:DUF4174 domain-containing protein n=1 Tax=Motilimonas pumila TaxID=2303987 RepID=A0A418YEG4_9GAMM|nr:DUF4174 domain-containing protein [Motilimonas pumila]RJG47546.1 DUF4174 domain-containing protein [Motilimonas pumila]
MALSDWLCGLTLMGVSISAQAEKLETLASLQWSARVIVVWSEQDPRATIDLLNQEQAYLDERHVVWFVVHKAKLLSNYGGEIAPNFVANLNRMYPQEKGAVWLIGKDGGVKQTAQALNLDAIYGQIDAMPMRQREMQR